MALSSNWCWVGVEAYFSGVSAVPVRQGTLSVYSVGRTWQMLSCQRARIDCGTATVGGMAWCPSPQGGLWGRVLREPWELRHGPWAVPRGLDALCGPPFGLGRIEVGVMLTAFLLVIPQVKCVIALHTVFVKAIRL